MAQLIQDLPGEIWKPVVGYVGCYEVSDCGRVRSMPRVVMRKNGAPQTIRARVLKQHSIGDHWFVRFSKDGRTELRRVHRLELEAFVGPCPQGMEGCHNDGDGRNNMVSNLRWDTRTNNVADTFKHGTVARGERNGIAKLSEDEVRQIRAMHAASTTYREIAATFGIAISNVCSIVKRRSWKHVK